MSDFQITKDFEHSTLSVQGHTDGLGMDIIEVVKDMQSGDERQIALKLRDEDPNGSHLFVVTERKVVDGIETWGPCESSADVSETVALAQALWAAKSELEALRVRRRARGQVAGW